MKKLVYVFAVLIVVFAALLAFSTVDTSEKDSISTSGTVLRISEGGTKDVVFELDGHEVSYYINRGMENFTLDELEEKTVGQKVTVFYADDWTPLAPFGTASKHLTRIELNGEVVYSEF